MIKEPQFSDKQEDQELAFHLKIKKGAISPYVLLPGDPKRCGVIAQYLDKPQLIADNREYVIINGFYKGFPITVCSTGIGGPSASIAVEELIISGAHTFIRVGTSGALKLTVQPGDIVIAQAAVRDEGTANQYLPREVPLRANFGVIKALKQAVETRSEKHHIGLVHCKDAFYTELEPETAFFRENEEQKLMNYSKLGVLSSEMESAAIFAVGIMRKVKTGAIFQVVESPIMRRMNIHDHHKTSIEPIIETALEALVILAKQDKGESHE